MYTSWFYDTKYFFSESIFGDYLILCANIFKYRLKKFKRRIFVKYLFSFYPVHVLFHFLSISKEQKKKRRYKFKIWYINKKINYSYTHLMTINARKILERKSNCRLFKYLSLCSASLISKYVKNNIKKLMNKILKIKQKRQKCLKKMFCKSVLCYLYN